MSSKIVLPLFANGPSLPDQFKTHVASDYQQMRSSWHWRVHGPAAQVAVSITGDKYPPPVLALSSFYYYLRLS
jgi:hypothetical protein